MMLHVTGVRKRFADSGADKRATSSSTEVLKGIDLDVNKGDVVAILGPSGWGKTTFLRCLNFLERADAGHMVFDEISLNMPTARKAEIARLRKKTAFVFQNYNLFQNMTVLQNVTVGLTMGYRMPRHKAHDIAIASLERVGMAGKLSSYPAQLSGGQQQRVAIARALASSPEIIYFDEPTSALDPELIGEVLSVMRQLARDGMTMLVVTHEMEFARSVSNHVLFMEDGVVVESGPTDQFFSSPHSPRTRDFISTLLSAHE